MLYVRIALCQMISSFYLTFPGFLFFLAMPVPIEAAKRNFVAMQGYLEAL